MVTYIHVYDMHILERGKVRGVGVLAYLLFFLVFSSFKGVPLEECIIQVYEFHIKYLKSVYSVQ